MVPGLAGVGSAVDIRLRAFVREETPPTRTWRDDITLVLGLAAAVVVVCSALSV